MKNNLESADNLAESLGDAQSAAADALVYGSILCSLSGILLIFQLLYFRECLGFIFFFYSWTHIIIEILKN